jgi:hypothetical protein
MRDRPAFPIASDADEEAEICALEEVRVSHSDTGVRAASPDRMLDAESRKRPMHTLSRRTSLGVSRETALLAGLLQGLHRPPGDPSLGSKIPRQRDL